MTETVCRRARILWLCSIIVLALFGRTAAIAWSNDRAKSDKQREAFFESKVRPLLSRKCWECHGKETQESGLRLDRRQTMLRGGHSGEPAVVPGKPGASTLIKMVSGKGDEAMPPDEGLPPEEIRVLKQWIADGAYWPQAKGPVPSADRSSWDDEFEKAHREHWALQPITVPPEPAVRSTGWVRRPIDRYVLAKLEAKQLRPSQEADRRTLIRRATFDLWGLPPTPKEIEAFLNDRRDDAYERLIDRLLASPRYGERWGRFWLDVARYADTRGYAFGRERRYAFAYTYRDYVIEAMNDDVPFDQFIIEQLAADQMPDRRSDRVLAALGFLTVGRKYNNRHEDIDDQIDVVSRGLLGLTVTCARCHDHKYDPIPSDDYYSLYGVFASSIEPKELPLIGDPTTVPGYAAFKKELDKRQAKLDAYAEKKIEEITEQAAGRTADYLAHVIGAAKDPLLQEQLAAFSLSPDELRPALIVGWRQYLLRRAKPDDPVWGPLVTIFKLSNDDLKTRSQEFAGHWSKLGAGTKPGQLNPLVKQRLLARPLSQKVDAAKRYGELLAAVWRRVRKNDAKALPGVADDDPALKQLAAIVTAETSPLHIRREDLRRYLNRADNNHYRQLQKQIDAWQVTSAGAPPRAMVMKDRPKPVEPRVFIRGNPARPGKPVPRRFLGMVEGPQRSGFPSDRSGRLELAYALVSPDNPLTARVFVNRVWAHHFGRPLVLSPSDFGVRTPQPVQHDVLDALAARFIRDGWSIKQLHRQIMNSATYRQSSLDRPGCRQADPENDLLWRMNRRRLEWESLRDAMLFVAGQIDLTQGGRSVDILKRPFSRRRTVYAFIDRQDLPGLFRVFDFANPDQTSPGRPHTTVPQQALFMLNSPFVIEQARKLAARTAGTAAPPERVTRLFLVALGREPTEGERAWCLEFVKSQPAPKEKNDKNPVLSPWERLAQSLLCCNEFSHID